MNDYNDEKLEAKCSWNKRLNQDDKEDEETGERSKT